MGPTDAQTVRQLQVGYVQEGLRETCAHLHSLGLQLVTQPYSEEGFQPLQNVISVVETG